MPKNKREKKVALTNVKPKGMEHKEGLVDNIRAAVEEFENCFTFDLGNLRTNHLALVRKEFKDSRIFLGKNKVMAIALGRSKEESHQDNLYKLAAKLTGTSGLLFTNRSKKEVKQYFATFEVNDYARAGAVAAIDFSIPQGPIEQFGHEMMDQLMKLGLPIQLDKGTLLCLSDTRVAVEGEVITPEASQLMKLWGYQSATFRVLLTAHWSGGVARAIAPPKTA
eukprot:TRINITY_DN24629_c0_g1_i1.p2 TRINITY_DN24629_c0_g1~~TRINITY_DN24629_c0_g1_i1.p2  ORF type:complete len:223 (+),score=123.74 TRINITY_DN24629_c0_g1_i1:55-723(+)